MIIDIPWKHRRIDHLNLQKEKNQLETVQPSRKETNMKKIVAVSLLFLCLGCANITLRPICRPEDLGPYSCTSLVSGLIADPFHRSFQSRSEFVYAIIEWPLVVIDWPFDFIADTIMFPYDYYVLTRSKKKGETE